MISMSSLYEEISAPPAGDVPVRRVTIDVNGQARTVDVEPRLLLAHLIRQGLKLTGTHTGCDTTSCGACTVLFDGRPIKSCTMFAVQADGHKVETVESLASASELHPIQEGFKEKHGLQCGFCTPGMMMSAVDLINRHARVLTPEEVRSEMEGNLCRCTGYHNIVKAIVAASEKMHAR